MYSGLANAADTQHTSWSQGSVHEKDVSNESGPSWIEVHVISYPVGRLLRWLPVVSAYYAPFIRVPCYRSSRWILGSRPGSDEHPPPQIIIAEVFDGVANYSFD
jgi:hypothetical protein